MSHVFTTRLDLAPAIREQIIPLLNQSLADASDLYTQTKQAHWNVKGMEFIALHKMFDEFAEQIEDYVDMLAERVTALGGTALGTARLAATNSRLSEFPLDVFEDKAVVEALADRYAQFASSVREAITVSAEAGDIGTSDLFTEISREIDKLLWFLEAHLQV